MGPIMPSESEASGKKTSRASVGECPAHQIRFLDYVADLHSRELFRNGEKIALQDKPFQVLELLLQRPGELIARKEICRAVWSDAHEQTGASLNTAIKKLRAALEDPSNKRRIIETVGSKGYRLTVKPIGPVSAGPQTLRIAVTPFENLGDSGHDYFADWLTEQMIVQLADPKSAIKVVVPVSPKERRTGKDLCDAVRGANPDFIVAGSVLRTGLQAKVTAKLVRAGDCECVWTQTYVRDLKDLFRAQDEITLQIACSILPFLPRPAVSIQSQESASPAYGETMKGSHFAQRCNEPAFARALEHFDQAIAADPNFARAYGALARTYANMLQYGVGEPLVVQAKLRAAAAKALAISPELPKALVALGCVETFYEANWIKAEEHFQHALQVSPEFGYAHRCYARLLLATGRKDESIAAATRACGLEPLSPYSLSALSAALYFGRRYQESLTPCMECIEIDPAFSTARFLLGRIHEGMGNFEKAVHAYRSAVDQSPKSAVLLANLAHGLAVAGNKEEARGLLNKLLVMRQTSYLSAYWIAMCHLGLGEVDSAIKWLQTAVGERCGWRVLCAVDPKLDAIRETAAFRDILRVIGFPQVKDAEGPLDSWARARGARVPE
jgi:DNA-binding winged helix-turn-helix (wHTH) protein